MCVPVSVCMSVCVCVRVRVCVCFIMVCALNQEADKFGQFSLD